MKTTSGISPFHATKNHICGRISKCVNKDELILEMKTELLKLQPVRMTIMERNALIGIDISEGISAANRAIGGDPDALDG